MAVQFHLADLFNLVADSFGQRVAIQRVAIVSDKGGKGSLSYAALNERTECLQSVGDTIAVRLCNTRQNSTGTRRA